MGGNRQNYEAVFVNVAFYLKKVLFFFLLTKKRVNILCVNGGEKRL